MIFFILLHFCILNASVSLSDFINVLEQADFEHALRLIELVHDGKRKLFESYYHFYTYDYLTAYEKVRQIEIGHEKVKVFKKYLEELVLITKDFKVYYSTGFMFCAKGDDVILYEMALASLEEIRKKINDEFGYTQLDVVRVEVYPTKDEFSKASTIPMDALLRSGAVGICKFNRLMILSPRSLPYGYRWLDTLSHEYIHLIINRLTKGKCPLWLHEGIARYYDTIWRSEKSLYLTPGNENLLYEIKTTKRFIPFERMEPSLVFLENQDEVSYAFVQLSSFIEFLIENYGEEKLKKLLHKLAHMGSGEAFKRLYGRSLKQLKKEYFVWLSKKEINISPGAVKEKMIFAEKEIDDFIGISIRDKVRLGDRLRQIGDYKTAVVQYEDVLRCEPYNPVVLTKLAKAYDGMNKREESERCLKLAIEKNPNFVSPYETLGDLYFKQGRHDEAIEVYNEMLEINPFNHLVYKRLGLIYINKKEYKLAEKMLEMALKLNKFDFETNLLLESIKEVKNAGNKN